jgi:ribonuclease HI
MSKKTVLIYADGSCIGNPGPGGWAAILKWGEIEKSISGKKLDTTNNRMELLAVIKGLEAVKKDVPIEVFTDSQYVRNGIEKWLEKWQSNGWKASSGKSVKNQDLWRKLVELQSKKSVRINWIPGHQGIGENKHADELANKEAHQARKEANLLR